MATSSRSKLPVLNLAPQTQDVRPFVYPKERPVDHKLLRDISPDREDYLQHRSTEEIREDLKLRPGGREQEWKWLYQSTKQISSENDGSENQEGRVHSPRLFLLDDSVLSAKASARRVEGPWTQEHNSMPMDDLNLTVFDTLVSPRPLGPTHFLAAYESHATGTRPTVCKMPINDFLFVLNVPNLLPRQAEDGTELPPLPKRVHGDLPQVLLSVPSLEALRELIVYLHNKNQAELFRKVVPEWIHDAMHPLPVIAAQSEPLPAPEFIEDGTCGCFQGMRLLPSLRHYEEYELPKRIMGQRSVGAIAREVAATARNLEEEQKVVATLVALDALRENLQFVGYFGKELWLELDTTREILLKAVSCMAKQ